jgi:polyisoprenoid-binding protein YceI
MPREHEVLTMQLRRLELAAATLVVLSIASSGHAELTGATDPHVAFEASGPAGLKITGTTTELTATETAGNVVVTVALGNLTTGIGLRDQHMREKYLEVPKFPATTLTVARSAVNVPTGGQKAEGDVQGTLSLHGQSRPVTVHYDSKGEAGALVTHGKFRINMNDFGITVPSYLGVTVKPDVEVTASFKLTGG